MFLEYVFQCEFLENVSVPLVPQRSEDSLLDQLVSGVTQKHVVHQGQRVHLVHLLPHINRLFITQDSLVHFHFLEVILRVLELLHRQRVYSLHLHKSVVQGVVQGRLLSVLLFLRENLVLLSNDEEIFVDRRSSPHILNRVLLVQVQGLLRVRHLTLQQLVFLLEFGDGLLQILVLLRLVEELLFQGFELGTRFLHEVLLALVDVYFQVLLIHYLFVVVSLVQNFFMLALELVIELLQNPAFFDHSALFLSRPLDLLKFLLHEKVLFLKSFFFLDHPLQVLIPQIIVISFETLDGLVLSPLHVCEFLL